MNFDDYQQWTRSTAVYKDFSYPRLALAEETGELLGKFAKYVRDNTSLRMLEQDVLKEAGDVLWQLARVLDDMGLSLQDAAEYNKHKLESRAVRGVLHGSGDDR